MRRLLCTALLLLCCAYGCITVAAQEKGLSQNWRMHVIGVPDIPQDENERENWQPIRIAVSPKGLGEALVYCRSLVSSSLRWGLNIRRADFNEDLCDKTEGITERKANLFWSKIIPAAIKLHAERLRVKRVSENLMIPGPNSFLDKECDDMRLTLEQRKYGIPGADFLLYVGLTTSKPGTIICSYNEDNRPTSAIIKFRPKDIADSRHFIRIVAHEIGHGIGFNSEVIKATNNVSLVSVGEYGEHYEFKEKVMMEKVREHYDCANATGMRMESDTKKGFYPHFDRRIAKDELMSPYSGSSNGMFYTILSLAAFESTGHFKANFSKAENMTWGLRASCDFLDKKCTEDDIPRYGDMFCYDDSEETLKCTSDRFALGKCSKTWRSDVLNWVHCAFSKREDSVSAELNGYCPIIKPFARTSCENGDETEMPGSIVSDISRCLSRTSALTGGEWKPINDICAQVKCEGGKVHIRYKGNDNWHPCDPVFNVIEPKSRDVNVNNGHIICPNYQEVCI